MPFLVRIGVIPQNATKVGARGYAVTRTGRTGTVRFGKVEAVGRGTTRFHWCRVPKPRRYTRKTVRQASELAEELVRHQLLPNVKGSYQLLPSGVRILAPR